MIHIDDLITPITPDEYMAKLTSVLGTLGVDVSKFRKGGALRVLMRGQSMIFSGLTTIMSSAIRSGFLDLAEGAWLTLLARYVFDVERREAQAASGNVIFMNGGGGTFAPGDYPTGSVRLFSSATGKKYLNAEPLDLGPFASKSVAVVAVDAGEGSDAAPGAIDSLETSLLGVTVTNPEAVVGLAEESDEDLRGACRSKLGSISGLGPRGAYEWAVRQAVRLDGTPTSINRVSVPDGTWTAVIDVVLAAATGAPVAGDVAAAEESIENIARPSGIKVNVLSATEVPFARAVTIWIRRTNGVDANVLAQSASTAIGRGLSTYPVGGIRKPLATRGALYADWIKSLCKVHEAVFDVDLSDDSDLELEADEVVVWTGTVQVRVA